MNKKTICKVRNWFEQSHGLEFTPDQIERYLTQYESQITICPETVTKIQQHPYVHPIVKGLACLLLVCKQEESYDEN